MIYVGFRRSPPNNVQRGTVKKASVTFFYMFLILWFTSRLFFYGRFRVIDSVVPFKDEAQTDLFKDPVRTAL